MEDFRYKVHEKLQKAVELELATIPPYLTAVFSMHKDKNKTSADIIRSVFMEEMLHLTLAANVLSAIKGHVKLGEKNIPSYPLNLEFDGIGFKDRDFDVDLARFCESTIYTFTQIELPNWPEDTKLRTAIPEMEIPGYTIGEFYDGIKKDLKDLCDIHTEEKVFTGDIKNQISEDYYWSGGGKPIIVRNLKTAYEAIDEIKEQGEGADGRRDDGDALYFGQQKEIAHYFRFNEIYHKRYYKKTDPLKTDPSGEPLEIDYTAVYPIKSNCLSTDFENDLDLSSLNHEFNKKYSLMLYQLEEGFNGNPKVFYTAIMNGMHELSPIANKMVQMPIQNDPNKLNGSPSFEWVNPI